MPWEGVQSLDFRLRVGLSLGLPPGKPFGCLSDRPGSCLAGAHAHTRLVVLVLRLMYGCLVGCTADTGARFLRGFCSGCLNGSGTVLYRRTALYDPQRLLLDDSTLSPCITASVGPSDVILIDEMVRSARFTEPLHATRAVS